MNPLRIPNDRVPTDFQRWLAETLGQNGEALVALRLDNRQVVLTPLLNDPTMIARVQSTIERYRSVMQRLAE